MIHDISPPGETLQETLEVQGMTPGVLAERIGCSEQAVQEVLQGKILSSEMAIQLERVLGVPASFWNNRGRQYRASLPFDCTHPPPPELLRDIYNRCAQHIETRYGIDVRIADVLDPNTGDFNGAVILIDYDQDPESALFVLIHLFGHTVQWNVSEEYRRLGLETAQRISEEDLPKVYVYEREATAISLALLHEIGVTELDQWVSDWWSADWAYLRHIYRTGEKLNIRQLLEPGAEKIAPIPIPSFTPTPYVSRWSF